MRIHIIGASGSGKSYLSKTLAQKYNIPHFDLDEIFWDNSSRTYGTKTPSEKRDKMLDEILLNENWVIEGIYYDWVGKSFADADKIVLLDTKKSLCEFRIIRRFIKRKFGLAQGKKETLKSLVALLSWNAKYKEEKFVKIFAAIGEFEEKTVILHNKREIRKFLKSL